MGKRAKKVKQLKHDSETSSSDKEETKMTMRVANVVDDDDDEFAEANEDLSLRILEKAMQRQQHDSLDGSAMADGVVMKTELPKCNNIELKKKKKKKSTKKKTKEKEELSSSVLSDLDTNIKSFSENLLLEEQKVESEKVSEIDVPASTEPVESSENSVFRKLLRGPRYFDPPDSGWGSCYNCGEEGHVAFNCTAAKRVKPCFVCGSLEHNAKNCAKGKDCYICKKGGHIAKDCPGKNSGEPNISKMCLKCGDAGHDMFSCRSIYSADDLKEIQCYVCRKFGHLCCVEYTDRGPTELSCYKCGQLGHSGLACVGYRNETSSAGPLSSCYRCGEEGHFARECTSSTKVGKRNREASTPKKNSYKENDYEARSVPTDLRKAQKKKIHYDEGFASASKSKHRGGWSTEDSGDFQEHGGWYGSAYTSKRRGRWTADDPVDFHDNGYNTNGWRSPATPSNWKTKNYNYAGNDYASSPSQRAQHHNFSDSGSYGYTKYYQQHRFSASRFGNNSNDMPRRDYGWQ